MSLRCFRVPVLAVSAGGDRSVARPVQPHRLRRVLEGKNQGESTEDLILSETRCRISLLTQMPTFTNGKFSHGVRSYHILICPNLTEKQMLPNESQDKDSNKISASNDNAGLVVWTKPLQNFFSLFQNL